MREVLIISGKGGTGKTSFAAAFAHLAEHPVICDLDVDAPDLHLLLRPQHETVEAFQSGYEARILPERCSACGTCQQMCAYEAIETGTAHPSINPMKCEGCKVCVQFCPEQAIDFTLRHCGTWYRSVTRFGTMLHAQLFPGEENSGRLVALLRQQAKEAATHEGNALILSDGPPGIGCPVISAVSGVNLAVIVTEPTPSGIHDMERIVSLCEHFKVPISVVINKSDLNADITNRIYSMCRDKGFPVIAEVPHDPVFVEAMVAGKSVTEYTPGALRHTLLKAWSQICRLVGLTDTAAGTHDRHAGAAVQSE